MPATGTLLCGIATSMDMLILARAIAGMVSLAIRVLYGLLTIIDQGGGGIMTGSSFLAHLGSSN